MADAMSSMLSALFAAAMILAPAAAQPIRIVLAGDSTVNDEGGWGTGFRASFGPPIECINLARNGRSSKSFREGGWWAPALAGKPRFVYTMTLAQAEQLGPAGSARLGRQSPDGKLDTTHLGAEGQRKIGIMAARELARIEPALKPYLVRSKEAGRTSIGP